MKELIVGLIYGVVILYVFILFKLVESSITERSEDIGDSIGDVAESLREEIRCTRITVRRWSYIVPIISLSVAVLTFILVIILKKYGF